MDEENEIQISTRIACNPMDGSPDRTSSPSPALFAQPVPSSRLFLFALLTIAGAAVDLWTKSAIFKRRGLPGQKDIWWIIEGNFGIETAVNPGAVFGVGAGMGIVFAALSICAGIGIVIWLFWFRAAHSLFLTISLGLISGGIIGNLYDRLGLWWQPGYDPLWKSGVRDWILVRFEGVPLFDPWPNFNIADSLLVVGASMLMIQSFWPVGSPADDQDSPDTDSSDG